MYTEGTILLKYLKISLHIELKIILSYQIKLRRTLKLIARLSKLFAILFLIMFEFPTNNIY